MDRTYWVVRIGKVRGKGQYVAEWQDSDTLKGANRYRTRDVARDAASTGGPARVVKVTVRPRRSPEAKAWLAVSKEFPAFRDTLVNDVRRAASRAARGDSNTCLQVLEAAAALLESIK